MIIIWSSLFIKLTMSRTTSCRSVTLFMETFVLEWRTVQTCFSFQQPDPVWGIQSRKWRWSPVFFFSKFEYSQITIQTKVQPTKCLHISDISDTSDMSVFPKYFNETVCTQTVAARMRSMLISRIISKNVIRFSNHLITACRGGICPAILAIRHQLYTKI